MFQRSGETIGFSNGHSGKRPPQVEDIVPQTHNFVAFFFQSWFPADPGQILLLFGITAARATSPGLL